MVLDKTLKRLMSHKNLSVTKLSKLTDIPVSTLHGWLNGIEPRSITQLKAVSDYFEISLESLCFGEDSIFCSKLDCYQEDIKAGIYEVVLRRVKR